ncbi:hypothetical protein C8R44DRAFT_616608 [Mycena epipterygia]|nr:hypothetical protein C8R44DRAFT_616608 [Mycena epipterygia]
MDRILCFPIMTADPSTTLEVFRAYVANPETSERHAVECGDELWTYEDLDIISTGLALELETRYGASPTVAIIAENLPYTLALHLAVWKLRGSVAPIDYHTPAALLKPMLNKISPTCVVVPSTEEGTQKIVLDSTFPLWSFKSENTTMTALCQRFIDVSDLPLDQYPAPEATSISIYLFTSSASDVTNIKCVPLTHQTLLAQARALLGWYQRTFSNASLQNLRNLGWGPFSHMMTVTDMTCTVFLTGGLRLAEEVDNGYSITDSIVSDAQFTLIDADGNSHESEGELFVSSRLIARGYLDHDIDAFTIGPDGLITFKTGDRYAWIGNRLKWLGRKDDFIILMSGEMVDPRVLEKSLDACPVIARSCVIGNNFLRGSAEFLCALIELRPGASQEHPSSNMEISRAIRAVNRALSPPLRISWSRLLILEEGQQIPINKKGHIWRKRLEALYGNRVLALSDQPSPPQTVLQSNQLPLAKQSNDTRDEHLVREAVLDIVAHALRLSLETLELNAESTFAELGMDSAAALVIVSKLNERLGLNLPRNACHTHIDLNSLSVAILERLRPADATPSVPQTTSESDSSSSSNDVVIVGQAVRLPGDLNTPESFWEALVDMREDLLIPIPAYRWDHSSFYRKPAEPSGEPCDITFEKAGFIEVRDFDNAFFGISSAEAFAVSPVVRLVLETAFQALENANIPSSRLKGTGTGVFVAGGMDYGYNNLLFAALGFGAYTRFHGTGIATSTTCGRLSYLLDVNGPSISLDTACSGGMVAFDEAVQYLRSGQAETAIVCAANTHSWPGDFGFLSAQKMTSPNSRCATFSTDADGYVPSEGAVSLVLKTRRAALRDGDTILAVIKATNTKHNGKSQGLVAPSARGQQALQHSLLAAASLSPSEIDFIETHGTGTTLGDSIEIEGINAVFRGSHTSERPLLIGAAKASIGHTEVTAGLVGIVKAIQQLSTGKVPGLTSLAGGRLNPDIDTALVPIHIPSNLADLRKRDDSDVPYRALVVAYGFAGTISGTILEAPPLTTSQGTCKAAESSWMLFAISAKSRDALHEYLQTYLEFCANARAADFHASTPNPRIILAFPGQGSQFQGMASALAGRFCAFKAILTDAANMASPLAGFDLLSLLLEGPQPAEDIDRSAVAQICIFVYQYSVCQFLHKLGVRPDAVIGNSLGEISAAVEAGALSYELGLQFVVARARILSLDPNHPAGMVAIAASEATILKCIHDLHLGDCVEIAVFSSPESHVISGDLEAVRGLVSHVKKIGIRATLLVVDQGFHSHCIQGALPELETWVEDHAHKFRPLELPIFSGVLGKQLPRHESLQRGYWVDHARNPVRFHQAAAQIKEDKFFKNACILDVGPTPTAWAALQSNNIPDNALLSSSAKKGKDQELAFLAAIASLTEYGLNPDFIALFGTAIRKTSIPTYPFQRQRHYPTTIPSRSAFSSTVAVAVPSNPPFIVDEGLYEVLNDHRIQGQIVLPGAAMVDTFARSHPKRSLDIHFHRPLVVQSAGHICKVELNSAGVFALYDGERGDKLCSGKLSPMAAAPPSMLLTPASGPPTTVLTGDDVYRPFVHIQFGPLFRNIVSIQSWDNYTDGLIVVEPSADPENDRVRALDACIHMMGACQHVSPSVQHVFQTGAFLPMALEGYTAYTDVLPSSFICRYHLPIVTERNDHVAWTAFEIISHSGDLLAYCAKYSVAWVDMGIIPNPSPPANFSFQQAWIPKEVGAKTSAPSSKIAFFGRGCTADWISATTQSFAESVVVDLKDDVQWRSTCDTQVHLLPSGNYTHLLDAIHIEPNSTIILDATCANDTPESASFSAFWQRVLSLMKALGRNKTHTFNLVVVSTTLAPAAAPPILGPMIQGMLRVFRSELGLGNAYGIELPCDVCTDVMVALLKAELGAVRGHNKDNMVSYRYSRATLHEPEVRLLRFVPELRPLAAEDAIPQASGVAVIVGMGSIGFALGSHMISAGFSTVVFIGRRPATDKRVAKQLATLPNGFAYMSADVTEIDPLRVVLQDIKATFGAIKSILHTAAVVSDATIDSITVDTFDRVLQPKVRGAYNLHMLAEELHLELESFVLFSSISVPLGNPGQVAYVAGNFFLDSLAAWRRSMGRPGVSLQLGPWESELVANLAPPSSTADVFMRTMPNTDGLPLIMRALSSRVPVQVIAALDTQVMSQIPAFATDSLFAPLVSYAGATKPRVQVLSSAAVAESVVSILRGVLGLTESEPLELNESLTACGIDSIAFGQIRAKVLKQLGVDIPLVYLSDAFTAHDMLVNVQESVLKEADMISA